MHENKVFQVECFHIMPARYVIIIIVIFLFKRKNSQRVSFQIFDFRPGLANCGPRAKTNLLPVFVQLVS